VAGPGTFVVSLDLELFWGVHDEAGFDRSRNAILGERQVVQRLLDIFADYELRATWAAVGLLAFETRDELLAHLPPRLPAYVDARRSPYGGLAMLGADEEEDPFHFGASLLEAIRRAGGQEIATHTFSHFYALEPGQNAADFEADLEAAVEVARSRGDVLESIVFPRNQVNEAYLPICAAHGLSAYRGTGSSRLQRAHAIGGISRARRAARLVDSFVPLSRDSAFAPERGATLTDVPASRFFRPYAAWRGAIDALRVRRITSELAYAARNGLVYHLWWHPRNFAADTERNLEALRQVCDRFELLRRNLGMVSRSMADVARTARVPTSEGARV
jgi:peptidoglycan/xylan/chitin deacetylase (PgdA/CDA1 family)